MDELNNKIPEENIENEQTVNEQEPEFQFLGDPAKASEKEKKKTFRKGAAAVGTTSMLMPIIILGICALLLIGTVVTLNIINKDDGDNNTEQTDTIKLFNFTGTSAERFEIKNQVDDYAFVRKLEKTYYVEGHEDCAVANSAVLSALTYFGGLEAVTEVATDVTDLEQYGLTKPISTVTWIKGEKTHTLEIGDIAASGNYYVRVDGKNTVYTIASDIALLYCSPRMDYYSPDIYDFTQETDANYITSFEITRRGEDTIKIKLSDLSQEDIDSAYKIIEPISHNVSIEKSNMFTDLVGNMTSLTVYSDDVSEKSLKEHGLSDPAIEYSFVNVATEYRFRISDPTDKGYSYAYVEGGNFIYIVDTSTIEVLTYKLADYCEAMSYPRSYDTISSLTITGGGKKYYITLSGTAEDDDLQVYINNKYVEFVNYTDLYAHIIGIEIKDIRDKTNLGELLVTIEVKGPDGAVETLKYYKLSELDSAFVINDGDKRKVVPTAKVEQILEFAQNLYDGKEIVTES
ncbi:MAG: DUF4340 domain-containing protein [Clostridia bacterium]|nr:DUF4340 domain-containing protein [Clostridia bacterium]